METLRSSSMDELNSLCAELRSRIIEVSLKNGGHLGASLGAVEIAVALHRVFKSPDEPLLWDVGHQAYAHKLLTGRESTFERLRQWGGPSGFLSRKESVHDVFGGGHSSTALSAALGMAYARAGTLNWTVAVVGDGAMTAGLFFEALQQTIAAPTGPILLVLNDNGMSISKNVGVLPELFLSEKAKDFFHSMGWEYSGPIQGHDLAVLLPAIEKIKATGQTGRRVILHVRTQKGMGYVPAEDHPTEFHGVSNQASAQKTYSQVFGELLCRLAEKDPRIVAITAAMSEGTGLNEFAQRFPNRFFDVGIAEQHAVTFAASLATQGFIPVVAIYSTFLQRAMDSIIHDVALQSLGVIFAIDRAGLVGPDGATHHGAFDLAFLKSVPHFTISAPANSDEMESELLAAVESGGPWAIRYPRGVCPAASVPVSIQSRKPRKIAVGVGAAVHRLVEAAEQVDPAHDCITVLGVTRVWPMPEALVQELVQLADLGESKLLIVEDGMKVGGFGESLLLALSQRGKWSGPGAAEVWGLPAEFVEHGTVPELERAIHVSVQDCVEWMR